VNAVERVLGVGNSVGQANPSDATGPRYGNVVVVDVPHSTERGPILLDRDPVNLVVVEDVVCHGDAGRTIALDAGFPAKEQVAADRPAFSANNGGVCGRLLTGEADTPRPRNNGNGDL